jgi:sugar lactone lactonase YvrE
MTRFSRPSRTGLWIAVLALLVLAAPASAGSDGDDDGDRPEVIDLPVGFQPEGIVVAPGGTAYAGSLADGSVVAADLRSGEVREVYAGDGSSAVGIEHDREAELLYAAGGGSGTLEAIDPDSGELVDRVELVAPEAGFVNDVALHDDVVYATESSGGIVYATAVTEEGFGEVRAITLSGDFEVAEGFNANGIVALSDGMLVLVQSATGTLFRVDPETGEATAVTLDGEAQTLPNGDGIEREGDTLYVVQNRLNQIAVIDLDEDGASGTVERVVTNPAFDVPTTVDRYKGRLYVVNARFGIPDPASAEFQIVATELCRR